MEMVHHTHHFPIRQKEYLYVYIIYNYKYNIG